MRCSFPLALRARLALVPCALVAGCAGPQSALNPAGRGAERIADLFWVMLIGAGVIWVLVIGLAVYLTVFHRKAHELVLARALIVGGGVALPTTVLLALLAYGLYLMPGLRGPAEDVTLRIAVSGERWWWRVHYLGPDGDTIASANEIRLPAGERVEFALSSPDVIHSFWLPTLGGKVDMIPGRVNRMLLEPTEPGTYRGACAEFCGESHALMSFSVVVMEPAAFRTWLAHAAEPAAAPATALAERGQALFLANGCGACHSVRGTPARGEVGPDLTHVGGRESLAAGILPNEREAFVRWIAHPEAIKPGVRMPGFGMLPQEDLRAIAAYLDGLQ